MRKYFFCIAALAACLFCFCACDVSSMSSLTDISRPYTGEYRCEKLIFGGKEQKERFEFIKLNLDYGGNFELTYKDNEGNEGGFEGEYDVSEEKEEITFRGKMGLRTAEHTFPMEKGAILVDFNFGGRLLHAEFRLP